MQCFADCSSMSPYDASLGLAYGSTAYEVRVYITITLVVLFNTIFWLENDTKENIYSVCYILLVAFISIYFFLDARTVVFNPLIGLALKTIGCEVPSGLKILIGVGGTRSFRLNGRWPMQRIFIFEEFFSMLFCLLSVLLHLYLFYLLLFIFTWERI